MIYNTYASPLMYRQNPEGTDLSRPRHRYKGICMMMLILVLLAATGFHAMAASKAAPDTASQTTASKDVTYPANLFDNGKARYFDYKTGDGTTIRYFVIKSSDGVIRAAFDACDVCWPANKGYVQKDDFMICKNCGKRFHSTRINEVSGGCNPAPLERSVSNGKVTITVDNILKGKKYFTFQGGRK